MIDINKKYRTRDGREVRIYATDGGNGDTVHGAILEGSLWLVAAWNGEGVYVLPYRVGDTITGLDIIEVRPRHKRTVWLHVFKHTIVAAEEPPLAAIAGSIACIKVELDFQEGEGL